LCRDLEGDPGGAVQPTVRFRYPWTWLDDHGERISLAKWRGEPLVITAVYTTCFET
jgi:cytochrome oxidase Cu insertion factor (SCO1/SenC/PrrC family)